MKKKVTFREKLTRLCNRELYHIEQGPLMPYWCRLFKCDCTSKNCKLGEDEISEWKPVPKKPKNDAERAIMACIGISSALRKVIAGMDLEYMEVEGSIEVREVKK